jgi:hypothetical protein
MAILGLNTTNYSGEVLEQILTMATTTNELVEKGLIMVIPGVHKTISVPKVRSGKMLQKRKENPKSEDSKGNLNYSEKKLTPKDMMVYMEFNPRAFEYIWRPFQPIFFKFLRPNTGLAQPLENMPKLRLIFGEMFSRVDA